MLKRSKLGSKQRACCLKVKGALFVKSDIACGINEIVAQILCQNDGVKIFAAACSVVTACSVGKCVLDVSKFCFEMPSKRSSIAANSLSKLSPFTARS